MLGWMTVITERLGDREQEWGGGEGADGVESKREGRNEKYIRTKSWERYGQG